LLAPVPGCQRNMRLSPDSHLVGAFFCADDQCLEGGFASPLSLLYIVAAMSLRERTHPGLGIIEPCLALGCEGSALDELGTQSCKFGVADRTRLF
jgi:hypothetical protein